MFHQRVMRAPQNRGLGVGHFAFQRVNMAAHKSLSQDHVTVFDRIHDTAAGLRLNIYAHGPKCQFALKRAARNGGGRGKQRDLLNVDLSRGGIVAPTTLCHGFDERNKHPQDALAFWHASRLHPPQCRSGRGVAGQNHQIAAIIPKSLNRSLRELMHIICIAHAVGCVGAVAKIG